MGDSTWGGWAAPIPKMKGLNTDLVGQGWKNKGSGTLPSPLPGALPPSFPTLSPGWVWCGSEEVHTGLGGVPGQHGHHAGRGAEAPRVHTDAALLVPEDADHHLCRDTPCQGGHSEGPGGRRGPSGLRVSPRGCGREESWAPRCPLTDLVVAAAGPAQPVSGPWQPPCAQAAGSGRRPVRVKLRNRLASYCFCSWKP